LAEELDQKEAKIAQLNAQLQGMAIPVVKFSREGYKIREVFWLEIINFIQMKLPNLETWSSGEVSKSAKV
jgi:hypothetical protein